jgi:hypothetical protein
MRHTFRVLADAYIHELGENESAGKGSFISHQPSAIS